MVKGKKKKVKVRKENIKMMKKSSGVGWCKICNLSYVRAPHSGDFLHNCSRATTTSLRNEDVLNVVKTFDEFGTVTNIKSAGLLRQGIENRLWGTLGSYLGAEDEERSTRGKPVSSAAIVPYSLILR